MKWGLRLMVGTGVTLACSTDSGPAPGDTDASSTAGTDDGTANDETPDDGDGAPGDGAPGDGTTGGPGPGSGAACSADALLLMNLVNEYRGEHGLDAIPASSSMCIVGDAHVLDLAINAPDAPDACNMHSWSGVGEWSSCCYTPDHAQAECMWNKPRELTAYPGDGFENAASGRLGLTPAEALELWKGSPGHNDVILSQGIWANAPWLALGAGVDMGYAVLWFGRETDRTR